MTTLSPLLDELESWIPQWTVANPAVSRGSVGWHLEHSLLVLDRVLAALAESDPAQYRAKFNLKRTLVMLMGKIPRGSAQSPEAVRPVGHIDAASLQAHLSDTLRLLQTAVALGPEHFFTHPMLGDFRLRPALKFLGIHTAHHLHIVRDILTKSGITA